MIYTELTKKALRIAFDAHKDQVDKSGLPYIFHPYHIAEQMTDEVSVCVALLHDVVEDTAITFEDLIKQNIPNEVIDSLRLLTHDDNTLYIDYINHIKDSNNYIAIQVKLADLLHNSNSSRVDGLDKNTQERLKKYQKAINILEDYNSQKKEGICEKSI